MNQRSVLSVLSCAIMLAALAGCAEEEAVQQPKGTTTAPHPTGANVPPPAPLHGHKFDASRNDLETSDIERDATVIGSLR